MSWTSLHFAVGMGCTGLATAGVCAVARRGWRWLPALMTVGGIWAIGPDLPRLWRQDAPWLPLSSVLGRLSLEQALHRWGNLFFFHRWMDFHVREHALHGLIGMLLFYNLGIALLMWLEHRARNNLANRAWRAHEPLRRQQALRIVQAERDEAPAETGPMTPHSLVLPATPRLVLPVEPPAASSSSPPATPASPADASGGVGGERDPVLHRFGNGKITRRA